MRIAHCRRPCIKCGQICINAEGPSTNELSNTWNSPDSDGVGVSSSDTLPCHSYSILMRTARVHLL